MTLGQMWSNSITQNEQQIEPVTTNESVVSQEDTSKKYHAYKRGVLQNILQGAKLNEQETSR